MSSFWYRHPSSSFHAKLVVCGVILLISNNFRFSLPSGTGESDGGGRRRVRSPRGVSGRRAAGTLSATLRLLTARVMLREGHDPSEVAAATDIPEALVETMTDPVIGRNESSATSYREQTSEETS